MDGYPMSDTDGDALRRHYHDGISRKCVQESRGSMAIKVGGKEGQAGDRAIHGSRSGGAREYRATVIGDMNSRRGASKHGAAEGTTQIIKSSGRSRTVRYATDVRSRTQGSREFHYALRQVREEPGSLAEEIVARLGIQK